MKSLLLGRTIVTSILLTMSAAVAMAADTKEDAIKKDRQQIEGTWRIVHLVANGNPIGAKNVKVVNGDDGSWAILMDGKQVSSGLAILDPTKKPKTIEFSASNGEAQNKRFHGIYELDKNTRKLCFTPADKERPTEFTSMPESGHVLVEFERVMDE